MRLAQNEIERIGLLAGDYLHRLDHELQSFARIDQSERGQDRAARDAQLILHQRATVRLDRRHTVRNHRHPV
jgi:hypothetical protein